MPFLVGFHGFGAVHAESTGLESVRSRGVVAKGAGIREIHPHNRMATQGKRLGMTVSTPGHRDVGRAPEGVQNLALFIAGRSSGGSNWTMSLEDKVMKAQLGEEQRDSGLEDMGIQISADDDLVSCSQPSQDFST